MCAGCRIGGSAYRRVLPELILDVYVDFRRISFHISHVIITDGTEYGVHRGSARMRIRVLQCFVNFFETALQPKRTSGNEYKPSRE